MAFRRRRILGASVQVVIGEMVHQRRMSDRSPTRTDYASNEASSGSRSNYITAGRRTMLHDPWTKFQSNIQSPIINCKVNLGREAGVCGLNDKPTLNRFVRN